MKRIAIACVFLLAVAAYGQRIMSCGDMLVELRSALPAEEIGRIEKAMPVKAGAGIESKRSRRLLVFNLHVWDGKVQKGHASIPHSNYAIARMGQITGAYEAFFSSDTLVFAPDVLRRFDAICFNNTAGVLFTDPLKRKALLDYVSSGRGFIGIHAAGATMVQWPVYDQWPEFGDMLGGYENGGHPWKEKEWITLKIDDPASPINASFEGKGFQVSDEVFQFQAPWSRNNLHVLLSVDTSKTDMAESRRILPERRKDGDIAISWIREYGKGRVFYTSLGHNPHINWDPKILAHYLSGFQYCTGDLEADDTPSLKSAPALK
jgi:type 1 glutamine amidotransferase